MFKLALLICIMILTGYTFLQTLSNHFNQESMEISSTLENIPEYSGNAYVAIDNNIPTFDDGDMTSISFERYSELDALGRCGVAYANIGTDLMPGEKRGNISGVKPTGWQSVQYDSVDGKSLYNRCHLIGYQLTAENANKQNLITGTRYLNVDGMLPFENMVADYIKETNNHVLYRVTPIFQGSNLVANGVLMEGYSVEDHGEGICFKVYVYNVQPGIIIDYAKGDSHLSGDAVVKAEALAGKAEEAADKAKEASDKAEEAADKAKEVNDKAEKTTDKTEEATDKTDTVTATTEVKTGKGEKIKEKIDLGKTTIEIRANSNSMIYHCPGQNAYETMSNSKYLIIFHSEKEAQEAGYRKAKR